MNKRIEALAGVALMAGLVGWAQAQLAPCLAPTSQLFGLGLEVIPGNEGDPVCGVAQFGSVDALYGGLGTTGLQVVNPTYTGFEPVNMDVFFNSVPMSLSFPDFYVPGGATAPASGTQLVFLVPVLGVNQTFGLSDFNGDGVLDRNDARDELENFLKNSGIIGRIMKYQAANSPHSPISGPGGLIPTAVAADFGDVFDTMPSKAETQPGNVFGVGLSFTSFSVRGLDTQVTTLPLSYTVRNNIDPRRQMVFSMPITLSDTEGAKSYHVSPGMSYRVPMNDAWSVAPAVRLGVVASEDIASVSAVASASVASTYVMRFGAFDMAIGNMLGYYTTLKVKSGDYSADPGIDNVVLRNGVMLNQPLSLGGMPLSLEYSLIDTRYLGTDIYVDNTQELSVTLGTNRSAFSSRSFVRGGLNYLHGRDTQGLSINIGYWF